MRRIALIAPGGVAPPDSPFRIPALAGLAERLSRYYRIMVYSLNALPRTETADFQLPFDRASFKMLPGFLPGHTALPLLVRLFRDHRSEKFALVHGFWAVPAGLLAVLAGKLLRIPSLVSLQGGEPAQLESPGYGNMRKPFLRRATLLTCRWCTQLTLLTRYQQQQLRRFGFHRRDSKVIPYGAEPAFYMAAERILNPPYRFLFVGNLHAVKDPGTLLNAFASLSRKTEACLRIIGPDYWDGQVQRLIRDLKLENKVTVLGKISHQDLPAHYRWAHFLLLTSRYEGQAVVVAEAAAAGVIICGTRVGLIADLGKSRTLSSPVGDADSLAQEILDALKEPERLQSLRGRAYQWAQKHSAEWTAEQFGRLYKSLLK